MEEQSTSQHESLGRRYVHVGERLPNTAHFESKMAPLPFKLYRDCEQIPLGYESPERLSCGGNAVLTYEQVGQMLSDIYGFTRQYRIITDALQIPVDFTISTHSDEKATGSFASRLRRPVPSGGALFPCELYLLIGQGQVLPPGIYHYDAVHHALDILRKGDYSTFLESSLAQQQNKQEGFALLLSCLFWKDGCKYGEFSYRLQSLDIGVVIAQSLVMARRYGKQTLVHYQFLDQMLNQLVGLDYLYESIYAVITYSSELELTLEAKRKTVFTQLDHCSVQVKPLTSISQWPLLDALHHASIMTNIDAFRIRQRESPISVPQSSQSFCLPDIAVDLLARLHGRHSALGCFKREPLTFQQLAALLIISTQGYENDLDDQQSGLQHTLLYCVINSVEEIPPGVYYYHPEKRTLELVYATDVRRELQATLRGFYNISNASVCFFPVANYEYGFEMYGDRWYRMQNMEAGISIQRIHLAASALELGCQVNLGYYTQLANTLLHLPAGHTCLAQLMVAPEFSAGQSYEQPI